MVFPPGPPPVLQIFLNRALERGRVGPNHFAHLLPVLEQQERRHRTDAELLGHVGDVVDVEFVEARGGVDIGESVPISQRFIVSPTCFGKPPCE